MNECDQDKRAAERLAKVGPNDVDNYLHRLNSQLGTLPDDVLLIVKAFEDNRRTAPEALGELIMLGVSYK